MEPLPLERRLEPIRRLQQIYVSAECDFYLSKHSLCTPQGVRRAPAVGVTEARASECKSLTRGCLC